MTTFNQFPPDPLTGNRAQTGESVRQRIAAIGGQFPGPTPISQGFDLESGLQQLNDREARMLRRVTGRLRRERENPASFVIGRTFGF